MKSHSKPTEPTEDKHPGPISNDEDLCDPSPKNLKGTGKVEAYDPDWLDKYLKSKILERYDFKVINQELHTFLQNKYGGSVIKRYTVP